jgi:hypothetical protein
LSRLIVQRSFPHEPEELRRRAGVRPEPVASKVHRVPELGGMQDDACLRIPGKGTMPFEIGLNRPLIGGFPVHSDNLV